MTPDENRSLPTPILPRNTPWYWVRSRVHCEGGAAPEFVVCDNPDFLDVYVNGRHAEPTGGSPLWTEENVWFDVSDLFVKGWNTICVRARTSKYNDPRIGAFPALAARLQPVVVVGTFGVTEDLGLAPWSGTIDVSQPWEKQAIPHAAGVGIYRRSVAWDGRNSLVLHLPRCTDAVDVRVNDLPCGVRTWPPYVFDLTEPLDPGDNVLEIRVSNTLGNIITETYAGRAPRERPQSGLLAPPKLLTIDRPLKSP